MEVTSKSEVSLTFFILTAGSNSISHALLTPKKPFPRVLVVHGHLLDTMGITVRTPPPAGSKGKGKTSLELLPEEALYLLERGSLQIWIGRDPETDEEIEAGVGEWCDEEYGVKGAIEMSVMEGFGAFIGREGLTWERYQVNHFIPSSSHIDAEQAYSYLKRLGYNVQRSRQFIPEYFLTAPLVQLDEQDPRLPPFNTWWLNIPKWIAEFFKAFVRGVQRVAGSMASVGLGLRLTRDPFKGTLLNDWRGSSYSQLLLRLIGTLDLFHLQTRYSPICALFLPVTTNHSRLAQPLLPLTISTLLSSTTLTSHFGISGSP